MVQETIPTLYPELREAAPPPGRGRHGYYRKRNGWITTGPTTPSNRSDFEYMGHILLSRYGEFVMGTAQGEPRERDARGVPWNSADEPWRLIFQKGGAHEFPIDQIIAHGWHLRPPYREVKFPQLADVDVTNLPCPECNRVFSAIEPTIATQQLRVHLTSKTSDSHQYTPQDLRELGKEWGLNFDTRRYQNKARTAVAEAEASSLETEAELPPEMEAPAADVNVDDMRAQMRRGRRRQ